MIGKFKNHVGRYCAILCLIGLSRQSAAQETGIGIGTIDPHPSAVLHIESATGTQGVLFPVLSSSQRSNIKSKAQDGLITYDEDEHVLYQKNNGLGTWQPLYPVPSGIIVMWSGNASSIPDGWKLCNGSNNTPDLRQRFIAGYDPGAGAYNNPGNYSTGGSTAGDRGGSASVTLTTAQMPSHKHTLSGAGIHNHSIVETAHRHQQMVNNKRGDNDTSGGSNFTKPNEFSDKTDAGETIYTKYATTGVKVKADQGSHTHSIGNSGSGNSHENRPPYYTLAFIMKE